MLPDESSQSYSYSGTSPPFTEEPECSLPCSQEHDSGSMPSAKWKICMLRVAYACIPISSDIECPNSIQMGDLWSCTCMYICLEVVTLKSVDDVSFWNFVLN
jgi:hypothetical protein